MKGFCMLDIYDYVKINDVFKTAEKYNVRNILDHEIKVENFAGQIYDELNKKSYLIGSYYRNLLSCSAILHDVGCFINKSNHQRHTKYIILQEENFQAVPWELKHCLSIIAGSHGKNVDCDIQLYDIMKKKELLKLIAILRVSDALDHTHRLNTALEEINLEDNYLYIHVKSDNIGKIFLKLNNKSVLFEEMFSIKVRLKKV
ncbi:HD domain-containing protein [Clostridium sp. HV4-5-A1G]|jgi:exopolyphosphatase/guanosine-5'-triphosphate,3'-diphosphate pyrophosphatase|nr:HD domain-containing protein [Clostridium sp. HV4-5-A1G]